MAADAASNAGECRIQSMRPPVRCPSKALKVPSSS
jgi:hypothetical protein